MYFHAHTLNLIAWVHTIMLPLPKETIYNYRRFISEIVYYKCPYTFVVFYSHQLFVLNIMLYSGWITAQWDLLGHELYLAN